MVYICHRTEAQPRSCGKYRPFFEFLYLSPGTKPSSYNLYSFIYCFSLGFPNFEFSENIGSQLLPYITIQELNFCPIFVTGVNKYNYIWIIGAFVSYIGFIGYIGAISGLKLFYNIVHCCTTLFIVVKPCTLFYNLVHCLKQLLKVQGCALLYIVVLCCTRLYTVVHFCTL